MNRKTFLDKARAADLLHDDMQEPARHLVNAAWLYGKGLISDAQRREALRRYGGAFLDSDGTRIPAWHLVARSASRAAFAARGTKPAPGYPWEGYRCPPKPPETAYAGYAATITAFVGYAAASDEETLEAVVHAVRHARRAWAMVRGEGQGS